MDPDPENEQGRESRDEQGRFLEICLGSLSLEPRASQKTAGSFIESSLFLPFSFRFREHLPILIGQNNMLKRRGVYSLFY